MADVPWQLVRLVGPTVVLGPPVAYYVYRDRRRRGEPFPVAWALGVGLFNVTGLLVYLYLRGDFTGAGNDDEQSPEQN